MHFSFAHWCAAEELVPTKPHLSFRIHLMRKFDQRYGSWNVSATGLSLECRSCLYYSSAGGYDRCPFCRRLLSSFALQGNFGSNKPKHSDDGDTCVCSSFFAGTTKISRRDCDIRQHDALAPET